MNRPITPAGTTGTGLSRRSFLRAAAGGALGLGMSGALSGCGSPVVAGLTASRSVTDTVSFWNLFGGGDGVRMQDMEAGFRKKYPKYGLEAVTLAWGNPYYTKLSLATLGDRPPDVAVSHLTRMRTLVAGDLLQELRPEDLARYGMSPDKFNERAWKAGLVDGKAYAIPIDTHPFVMFWNTDVAKKAGLLASDGSLKPIDSDQKLVDALSAAKKVTGKFGAVVGINADPASCWRIFQSLYSQLGGKVLDGGGTKVVIDDAKAEQVLTLLKHLTDEGLMPGSVDYPGAVAMFAGGQAGFHFQGEWEISTFQTAKTPFSMTNFPNVFGGESGYAVQADSHTLVVPRQPAHQQEHLDRALTFAKSMLDQSKTWALGGHVPAWLPFRDSETYKKMSPQSSYAASADAAVYDPDGWFSGSGSDFETVMGSAIGATLAGQLSPKAALGQIHARLTTLTNTAPPVTLASGLTTGGALS
jgi:multiple sugar transport system substrate-binding protein